MVGNTQGLSLLKRLNGLEKELQGLKNSRHATKVLRRTTQTGILITEIKPLFAHDHAIT